MYDLSRFYMLIHKFSLKLQRHTGLTLNMWLCAVIPANHKPPPLLGLLMDASTYSALFL